MLMRETVWLAYLKNEIGPGEPVENEEGGESRQSDGQKEKGKRCILWELKSQDRCRLDTEGAKKCNKATLSLCYAKQALPINYSLLACPVDFSF